MKSDCDIPINNNDNYNVYGYFNNEISRRTLPLTKT